MLRHAFATLACDIVQGYDLFGDHQHWVSSMFQVLSFEDDSLPKVRRALMFVASLLVLTVWADLKLNLTNGMLRSVKPGAFDPAAFDPSFVLIPLLIYLVLRALITSVWYLPLAKFEHTKDDPKFQALAVALREYIEEAKQRAAYVAPAEALAVPQLNDQANWVGKLRDEVDRRLRELERDRDLAEGYQRWGWESGTTAPLSDQLRGSLAELWRSVDALQGRCAVNEVFFDDLSKYADEFNVYTETFDELRRKVEEMSKLVRDNVGSKKLQAVVSAFGALNSEIVVAAARKAKIELWFGLLLPLLWALFALCLAWRSLIALAAAIGSGVHP